MGNTKMTDKQKVTTMADSDYVFGNFGGKVGQMSILDFRSHLYDDSPEGESPELSALKSRISSVEDKNTEQDARINTLLQDTPWEGRHMNSFTETGEYHIHGERTDANDGLPILNAGSGHTIDARLTVLDSSLTRGTGEKTDIVVTQILRLSNRTGGDGHVYVRTAQAANKSQLATPSSTAWGTWEKLLGMFEKNAVTNIADLDTYTTNGMYSGLFADTTLQSLGGLQFTPGDTFLLITVNGYAASAFGTPQLTQMLYRLPAKQGSGNYSARMYLRTAYWNKDAEPKAWVWANWDRLAMASEISGGGGGSIEEYNRLIELIAANTEKISSVESTANAAKSAAETAQTAATTAQETANSARETATAASTAAQEAKTAADNANNLATEAQTIAQEAKEAAEDAKKIKEYKLLHSHTFPEDATSSDYELLTADDGTPIHQYKDILIFAELSYVEGGSTMAIYLNINKGPRCRVSNIASRDFATNYIFKLKIDGLNTTFYSENHTNSFFNGQYSDGNQGVNFVGIKPDEVFTYDRLTINFPFKANNKILIYGR